MNEDRVRHKFWMVLVDEVGLQPRKHYNRVDAESEAELLAKKYARDVFVLMADEFVRFVPPEPPTLVAKWDKTVI